MKFTVNSQLAVHNIHSGKLCGKLSLSGVHVSSQQLGRGCLVLLPKMGVNALQNLRCVSQYLRSLPGVKPRLITDRGEAMAEAMWRDWECLMDFPVAGLDDFIQPHILAVPPPVFSDLPLFHKSSISAWEDQPRSGFGERVRQRRQQWNVPPAVLAFQVVFQCRCGAVGVV